MKDTFFKIKKELVVQKVEDEVFIFDGETSILHTLNETAADLFKKLKKGASAKDLSEYLVREYDISKGQAVKDITDFIKKLEKKKLLIEKKTKSSSHE